MNLEVKVISNKEELELCKKETIVKKANTEKIGIYVEKEWEQNSGCFLPGRSKFPVIIYPGESDEEIEREVVLSSENSMIDTITPEDYRFKCYQNSLRMGGLIK